MAVANSPKSNKTKPIVTPDFETQALNELVKREIAKRLGPMATAPSSYPNTTPADLPLSALADALIGDSGFAPGLPRTGAFSDIGKGRIQQDPFASFRERDGQTPHLMVKGTPPRDFTQPDDALAQAIVPPDMAREMYVPTALAIPLAQALEKNKLRESRMTPTGQAKEKEARAVATDSERQRRTNTQERGRQALVIQNAMADKFQRRGMAPILAQALAGTQVNSTPVEGGALWQPVMQQEQANANKQVLAMLLAGTAYPGILNAQNDASQQAFLRSPEGMHHQLNVAAAQGGVMPQAASPWPTPGSQQHTQQLQKEIQDATAGGVIAPGGLLHQTLQGIRNTANSGIAAGSETAKRRFITGAQLAGVPPQAAELWWKFNTDPDPYAGIPELNQPRLPFQPF